jgi:mRNA interferase MazF
MITSAKNSSWESDHLINSLAETGLTSPSIIRQKIFTLDTRLIIKSTGKLSSKDKKEILKKLSAHLQLTPTLS